MTEKLANIIYKILFFHLRLLDKILNVRLSYVFMDLISKNSYEFIYIKNKKVFFFIPNSFTKYRLETFFTKEVDTINWIKNFKRKKNVFWDIGANIGNYSIFSAILNNNTKVYAFEPSALNLRVLSRNISINNLEKKITIIQLPLSNKSNQINLMQETTFEEGGSFNSFGVKYNSSLKSIKKSDIKNKYNILGTSLDSLVRSKSIDLPDYIKIDVDGIEHLVLSGARNILVNKKIKSILIELYPDNKLLFNKSIKILRSCNFKFDRKKGFNYIFKKI